MNENVTVGTLKCCQVFKACFYGFGLQKQIVMITEFRLLFKVEGHVLGHNNLNY